MEKEPIIALDFPTWQETEQFLVPFRGEQLYVKVGMELYLQNGPFIIEQLKQMNHRIFLDLKLHDIPNTVGQAMKGLAALGVDMINVHAAGGVEMMKRACEGLDAGAQGSRPVLLAVTQLTSTSEEAMQQDQLIKVPLGESVRHYAQKAQEAGCDGVVCSVLEAAAIREACGEAFYKVTPGIRLKGGQADDQKRIADPAEARKIGSTMIVVGRPITKAADPVAAYQHVKALWGGQA
ncbi:orotidine-5'-phosphate decarboxylase [Domibacillus sp. DTU_2020_1001157_1_SI_ALB_TIR_016]|uniref:orotidine-5'-phosphate decarboxylase n=1 Tax=Domibacillus sp. DTU_2020_1001157_1_SI_ALB_TIR_016 TaxID=3077789 RepID=UPI0028ECAB8C|nr:orotidine-5'-phosphate decarboxylase [Domibacillus sp. DTU_2020_1001157_1_SI_ALB_TIR_016]WNS79781.1 orotidine-5'-phosphate decarboxylase [Domibacillus sp. DTU_2020_1001157_1_SI_ALB_TIR_016]